jgi:transcriptional regulator with XRE-family HTH domain
MNPILNYIKTKDITLSALAEDLEVSVQTVSRWARGLAIPRKSVMQRIVKVTRGKIQPNDFYKAPSK